MEVLKIALPNKGRLSQKIYELLEKSGLNFPTKDERTLSVTTNDGKYSLIFVRTQDIPKFVEDEVADVGVTGYDIVTEEKSDVEIIKHLDFGKCNMVVAIKDECTINTCKELPDYIKVATSFPNIAKEYFNKLGKTAKIIEVTGATEITPRLGLADVVVDITSTGATLKSNKLKIIDTILSSSAIIIKRKNLSKDQNEMINSLMLAINSVIDAQEKKYLMAHVPKNELENLKTFLPGLSSPTVTTLLGDEENVVVHVVVDKDKVFESIEKLKKIGGKGILIMTVDQMVK